MTIQFVLLYEMFQCATYGNATPCCISTGFRMTNEIYLDMVEGKEDTKTSFP